MLKEAKQEPMQLQFTKNVHFTRLLKTAEKLREFNFRKVPDAVEQLFHVDVADDRGNRLVFKLRKQDGRWKIEDYTLPDWILYTENTLHDLITEEGY